MQGPQHSLSLRIEYQQDGEVRQYDTIPLQTRFENQELPLIEIYRHVNEFLNRRRDLNPLVILTNHGRFCHSLYGKEIDVQQCLEREGYMIRITLKPLGTRKRLGESVREAELKLERLMEYDVNPGPQPDLNHRPVQSLSSREQEQDTTLGILYSDPLIESFRNNRPLFERTQTVSYEHEIHKIIRSTRVIDELTQNKKLNIKPMVAFLNNLFHLLRSPDVVWLHISCHGYGLNGNYFLRLQQQPKEYIGLHHNVTVEEFRASFVSARAKLGCLVIMACQSWKFADAVTPYVDFVVAIDEKYEVDNRAAELFSEKFYQCLLSGNRYQEGFDIAKACIHAAFNPCSCDLERPGSNVIGVCHGRHRKVECACPNKTNNRHLSECSGRDFILNNGMKLMDDILGKGYRWVCCCDCDHNERY